MQSAMYWLNSLNADILVPSTKKSLLFIQIYRLDSPSHSLETAILHGS